MPTINATVYPSMDYVLVEADWTDVPAVRYAGVTRRNTVTGETVNLRPYIAYDADGNLLLNCGLGLWWDTEAPLNVPLEYCTVASDVDTNVISNSTFEVALAPWAATGGAAVRSNLFAHTGTWSAQVTPSGTSALVELTDPTDYVIPEGAEVTFEAWVLTPQGWNAGQLEATVLYGGVTQTTFLSRVYSLYPGEWQLLRTTFTMAEAGSLTDTTVRFPGTPAASVLFYIDDVTVTYTAPVAATACETVTVTADTIWLRNPLDPCLDVEVGLCNPAMDFDCEEDSRISYAGMADDERQANTVLSEPVNQIYPIPTWRQRRAPRSELRLIAHDCTARDAILATNQPGSALLFQAPEDYCIPDRYISVGPLVESRISVDQREDFRLMLLPYAVVQRPEGPANGICGSRISDLCDIYTSWQSMTLSGLDWWDLLLGMASNDGPVNPLPPGARTWGDVETEFVDWAAVESGGTRDWGELRDGL